MKRREVPTEIIVGDASNKYDTTTSVTVDEQQISSEFQVTSNVIYMISLVPNSLVNTVISHSCPRSDTTVRVGSLNVSSAQLAFVEQIALQATNQAIEESTTNFVNGISPITSMGSNVVNTMILGSLKRTRWTIYLRREVRIYSQKARNRELISS